MHKLILPSRVEVACYERIWMTALDNKLSQKNKIFILPDAFSGIMLTTQKLLMITYIIIVIFNQEVTRRKIKYGLPLDSKGIHF